MSANVDWLDGFDEAVLEHIKNAPPEGQTQLILSPILSCELINASVFYHNETERVYLYKASNYGQFIQVFRYGPWVHRLIERAEQIKAANEAREAADRLDDRERRAANYTEVDF